MAIFLQLDPLQHALASLAEAAAEPLEGHLAKNIRDSVIQRFEYSYELAWKILKRALKMYYGYDEDAVREIFRRGHEVGLLDDADLWLSFHNTRNLTVHTYNENTAAEVYATALKFLPQAQLLLQRMEEAGGD